MKYLFVYLAAINILAFAAMGIDKAKARAGKWRIAEGTLFALAALGGPQKNAAFCFFRNDLNVSTLTSAVFYAVLNELV